MLQQPEREIYKGRVKGIWGRNPKELQFKSCMFLLTRERSNQELGKVGKETRQRARGRAKLLSLLCLSGFGVCFCCDFISFNCIIIHVDVTKLKLRIFLCTNQSICLPLKPSTLGTLKESFCHGPFASYPLEKEHMFSPTKSCTAVHPLGTPHRLNCSTGDQLLHFVKLTLKSPF